MKYLKTLKELNETNKPKSGCNCGCGGCSDNKDETVNVSDEPISENLSYHIDSGKLLTENVFRYGSESWFNLINEARDQYKKGNLKLSKIDEETINTDIGKKGIYNGKEVWLDMPMVEPLSEATYNGTDVEVNSPNRESSGGHPYKVYVTGCNEKTDSNPQGIKLVRFGSSDLRAKIDDPERRKAYDSRHGCSEGKHDDKCKPGYWSCRLPRYSSELNLSGSGQWW